MTELQERIIRLILENEEAMQIAADFIKREEKQNYQRRNDPSYNRSHAESAL